MQQKAEQDTQKSEGNKQKKDKEEKNKILNKFIEQEQKCAALNVFRLPYSQNTCVKCKFLLELKRYIQTDYNIEISQFLD